MKIGRPVVALIAAVTLGCHSANPHCHGGRLIAEAPLAVAVHAAPHAGDYELYAWAERATPPQPGVTIIHGRWLERGEAIGFRSDDSGQLFAVAGREHWPLPPGRYCWHSRANSEPNTDRAVASGANVFAQGAAVVGYGAAKIAYDIAGSAYGARPTSP